MKSFNWKKAPLTLTCFLMLVSAFAYSQKLLTPNVQTGPTPKQLAGPPAEFLTGDMKAVQPDEVGVRSQSAMIPVVFTQGKDGAWHWDGLIAVENGERFGMMAFSAEGTSWDIEMQAPGARQATSIDELIAESRDTTMGFAENQIPGHYYVFEGVQDGLWTVSIKADGVPGKASAAQADGFLLAASDSQYGLYSHLTDRDYLVGNELGVVAYGFDKQAYGFGQTPVAEATVVQQAKMLVTSPDGIVTEAAMFDDGKHNDGAAFDGTFGAALQLDQVGEYKAHVITEGLTPEGKPFVRTAQHVVPVIAPELELASEIAQTSLVDSNRMSVHLDVNVFKGAATKYRTYAEVWGSDAKGNDMPVAWIGGMVHAKNGSLDLGLDARWIAMSGAQAPFELRNVRIQDVHTQIAVATAENMILNISEMPEGAGREVTEVTNEMLMGVRPERATSGDRAGKLLLIHGYCSGDVWGSQQSQFSNSTVFYDLNKNRSHDAFANLIWNFGQSYSSYGIVAHSQGGCASLHLYTNYWSGLDDATGSRLIQSVGTPYQGTSLAGNLAALGSVFGAGCGTNYDLTYSGASSWLSGIPTWARNAANYYTTSFTDGWGYDYCHLATDLFLSDPEDGTTEKSYGQLSSGVNRGHKTGWCHTNSMRDPGQTTDSSRNSTMSIYAAR